MHAVYQLLSNSLLLTKIRTYLSQGDWVNFLLYVCNPTTGASRLCVTLGLNYYLTGLLTPLVGDWQFDEDAQIITI